MGRDRKLNSAAVLLVLGISCAACSRTSEFDQVTGNLTPTVRRASSPHLLELGKKTYEKNCAPCHGLTGEGRGEAAYLLFPKPRDFVAARYRLVSTWEFAPTDEDLFRTISRGMPGSAMPSWAHLPQKTRWALVHYIKSFARDPVAIGADHQPATASDTPGGRVKVPPEPPYTAEARARARELFLTSCAGCHGPTGKGDGQQKQEDSEGFPTRPRDLTAGIYKGSPEPGQVYCRIVAGLPGSPMPSHPNLYGNDAWHLVHYVRDLSSDQQRAQAEMKRFKIAAVRVDQLPDHPDSSVWHKSPATPVHLMPLWWRDNRPQSVTVQALHDGKELALQLAWADTTFDRTVLRPQDFRDAVAVQFALEDDPPFFAMGEAARMVNIWMWKSEKQVAANGGPLDLEKIYPNTGIDTYPNLQRSPLDQPMRSAPTIESDPTFITGWGADNIVSDLNPKSPAEDLTARGFGTLKARPPVDQHVTATGIYRTNSYRVVFRRAFNVAGNGTALFQPGKTVPVSFAVWDGSAGDRDGKKSVTIWQELWISP